MRKRATSVGVGLYRTTKKLQQLEARFQKLLENALPYMGQEELWIIDFLVTYYKRTQKVKTQLEQTAVSLREQESNALAMMDYLELPPEYMLYAMIPGEAKFAIWYDEDRNVHCDWIEIEPEPDPPNIMIFKLPPFDEPERKSTKKKGQVEEQKDDYDRVDDDALIALIKKLYDENGQPIKRRWEDLDIMPPEFMPQPEENEFNIWNDGIDYDDE